MTEEQNLTEKQIQELQNQGSLIWESLNNRIEQDEEFKTLYANFKGFYIRKFLGVAKTSEQKDKLIELIGTTVNTQFFHGYSIMENVLTDIQNDAEMKEFWEKNIFSFTEGQLRNQIGGIMADLFSDVPDKWYMNIEAVQNSRIILRDYHIIFDLYQETLNEIANFGAYQAILHSELYQPYTDSIPKLTDFLLGNPYELEFLNPQVFMKAQFYSTQHELWDLFGVLDKNNDNQWLGEIHLSLIPTDIENNKSYILHATLLNTIQEEERNAILIAVTSRLPDDIRALVQIRLVVAEQMEVVVLN